MAKALSAGALHGARGNSGVILSQILRGLADVTASAAADTGGDLSDIDAALFGAALRHAIGLVVTSMGGECIPGTIVSVLQAAAGAAEDRAADGDDLAVAVAAAADAAAVALDKTPGQLAVLADAGVVDSGRPRPAGSVGRTVPDDHRAMHPRARYTSRPRPSRRQSPSWRRLSSK